MPGDVALVNRFGYRVFFPILGGIDSVTGFKKLKEIVFIFIADSCCDLLDAKIRLFQKHAGKRQALFIHKLGKGAVILLFDDSRDLLGAQVQHIS